MKYLLLATILATIFLAGCISLFETSFTSGVESAADFTSEYMSATEARKMAEYSPCSVEGPILNTYVYNEDTNTWLFDIDKEKPGCNPVCVVDELTNTTEVNWRCTGLMN